MKHFRWLNTYEHGLWVSSEFGPEPKEINVFLDTAAEFRIVNVKHSLRLLNDGYADQAEGFVRYMDLDFDSFDFGEDEDEPSEWNIEKCFLRIRYDNALFLRFETTSNYRYELSLDPEFLVTQPE